MCEGATEEQVARELGIGQQVIGYHVKEIQEMKVPQPIEKRLEDFEEAYDKLDRVIDFIGEEEITTWASEIPVEERLKELKKIREIKKFFEEVERGMHRTFALSRGKNQ